MTLDGQVQRLELMPGDSVVLTLPMRLSQEASKNAADSIRAALGIPDLKVLVLNCGASLQVVRAVDEGETQRLLTDISKTLHEIKTAAQAA